MKNFIIVFFFLLLFNGCSSTKLLNFEGVAYTLNDVELKVNVKTNAQKFPSSSYTTWTYHNLSYSITNLSKDKTFEGFASSKKATLFLVFILSDGANVEHKVDLSHINLSPQMTSMEQPMVLQIPKNKNIKALANVRVEYQSLFSSISSEDSSIPQKLALEDLKKHVAFDTGCPIDKITIKDFFEQPGSGIYNLDVCDVLMKYRKVGTVFYKDGEDPLKKK